MEKDDENNAARPRIDVLYLKDEEKEGQTFLYSVQHVRSGSFQIVQHLMAPPFAFCQ